jgi:hypothetical protein
VVVDALRMNLKSLKFISTPDAVSEGVEGVHSVVMVQKAEEDK